MNPSHPTPPAPSGKSWWLEKPTREAFQEAHAKEVVRLKLENKHAFWDTKIVGYQNGKI